MKFSLILDKEKEEEVIVIAKERNELVDSIEKIVNDDNFLLYGVCDDKIIKIDLSQVQFFISNANKTYAYIDNDKYQIKLRLYQIEDLHDQRFLKINQSCIANIHQISSFKVTFGCSLLVEFENGYSEYVSRRELKNVKKRMGL
ncbi:MAG: LytTR family DNA-binding domain-containing protein [Bacillales bacterium]|nr:LytTR family DNA-binding domain-containing protein [Bacillales bacterium]